MDRKKASDTVLKPEELIRLKDYEEETNTDIEASLTKQAEISFKAGIKEVVEWIGEHAFGRYDGKTTVLAFSKTNWQFKLKEWGIKG